MLIHRPVARARQVSGSVSETLGALPCTRVTPFRRTPQLVFLLISDRQYNLGSLNVNAGLPLINTATTALH